MFDRTQKPGETVSHYTKVMIDNFDKLGLTDEDAKMAHYLKGLLPDLKYEILRFRPTSLEQMEELALSFETTSLAKNESNQTQLMSAISNLTELVSNVKAQTAPVSQSLNQQQRPRANNIQSGSDHPRHFNAHESGDLGPFCRRCNANHIFGQHVKQFYGPPRPRYDTPQYHRNVPLNPPYAQNNPRLRFRPVCYQCNRQGHTIRNCPFSTQQPSLNAKGAPTSNQ